MRTSEGFEAADGTYAAGDGHRLADDDAAFAASTAPGATKESRCSDSIVALRAGTGGSEDARRSDARIVDRANVGCEIVRLDAHVGIADEKHVARCDARGCDQSFDLPIHDAAARSAVDDDAERRVPVRAHHAPHDLERRILHSSAEMMTS
jgi:hypothetical protein